MVDNIIQNLSTQFEGKKYHEYASAFMTAASCGANLEKIGLHLTHYDSGTFDDISEEMLEYEKACRFATSPCYMKSAPMDTVFTNCFRTCRSLSLTSY